MMHRYQGIVILLAAIASVNGFGNVGRSGVTLGAISRRGTEISPINDQKVAAAKFDAHSLKRHRCFPASKGPFATTTKAWTTTMKKVTGVNGHQLAKLYSTSSPIDTSHAGAKTTAAYALILISILSFVGDNILRLPIFRSMYLYHRNWKWWQPITSIFCHGDRTHLSGNAFLMLLFGRSVEDELGSFGLLFSFIFCGVVSNLVSLAVLPPYTVSLGASGAVFGLFSISIFSRLSWRDLFDWRKIIEVAVLGQFVVSQFLGELRVAASGGIAGINHVAHLSGAATGCAMILLLRKLVNVLENK